VARSTRGADVPPPADDVPTTSRRSRRGP